MHAISRSRHRAIIAGTALVLVGLAGTANPATAAGGQGHGSDHAAHQGGGQSQDAQGKGKGDQGQPGQGRSGQGRSGQGQGHGPSPDIGHGQVNRPHEPVGAVGAGDPSGNNGTVKIETLGDLDGIPNNTPHPGCTFQVEWYGYDEGPDVISTVGFAMKAPTSDVALTVAGPRTVFVGGDPATGAGTETGLDGVQAYTLSFAGAAHPKQGYHVKLTVATPHSRGNDTKTKVFWVEPCETAPVEEVPGDEVVPGGDVTPNDTGVSSNGLGLDAGADQGVLGTHAEASEADREAAAGADTVAVPSRVDAGAEGSLTSIASSPLALMIAGLGILIAAAGLLARRRLGAAHTS
ncbi:MAG: hypothetical protein Q7J48_11750 [Nocardioides sp.]|nr:hypothetical protein [Nocardioides sp.]